MKTTQPLRMGLIGCGEFGRFCMHAYRELPDVRPTAAADVVKEAADSLAKEIGITAYDDPRELIASEEVDIVHIATPPSSHYELMLAALKAGKHVLCEKPLTITTQQADEIVQAAIKADRIAPVNFVLRYNAVTEAVKAVIDSGALGKVLMASLTNCASDAKLAANHWFWDKNLSGGIFIEHGVHFFDLYSYWFGPGRIVQAHAELRESSEQEDRVMCTVRHEGGAVSSQYHGFDQVAMLDRTDHRLVCELGDIRVEGWIPLKMTAEGRTDEEGFEKLTQCCPNAGIATIEKFDAERSRVIGRGKRRRVTRRIQLTYSPHEDKQKVYTDSVRALLADQIAYIRDHDHPRRITEANGRDAVALAETAANLAAGS